MPEDGRRASANDAGWLAGRCPQPSAAHAVAAEARQASLTKPAGSLGMLEAIAINLCALQATATPTAERAAIVLFAGDHGVTAQGVSAFPSSVTVEMLRNFASGGAAISVLASALGTALSVIDAGALEHSAVAGVLTDKPRCATRDFSAGRALLARELDHALAAGRRAVARCLDASSDILILGEMGIGNTTSAAAVAAALNGCDPQILVGAGAGLDRRGVEHKTRVNSKALTLHGLDRGKAAARDAVVCVGGLEIAALTGAIIAAAQARLPVLADGFIVSVAALAAVSLNPTCRPWLLFGHASAEHGHSVVLDALDARPILDLGLRLGEGSGAAAALPIVRLACALHAGMATFEEARVSGKSHAPDALPRVVVDGS